MRNLKGTADVLTPLLDGENNDGNKFKIGDVVPRETPLKTVLNSSARAFYTLLLSFQFVGLIFYLMRAFHCSLKERQTSFRCTNFTMFSRSEELEMAWIISQDITIAIFGLMLSRVPGFFGFTVIYRKVSRLPGFWSLNLLLVIEIAGMAVIVALANLTTMQVSLIAAFSLHGMALAAALALLNFTPINRLEKLTPFFIYFLYKVTLVLLFLQTFGIFLVGLFQLALKITGLDRVNTSADFATVFRKMREFPQVVFYYRVAVFFWQKLFLDDRNIQGHCERLKPEQ